MNGKLKQSGFTLMELLVVAGIFTLVVGGTTLMLTSSRFSVGLSDAQIEAEEHARRAMEHISKELRLSRADRVRISDTLGWTTSSTSGDVANFQIPKGIYDDDLNLTADYLLQWGSEDNTGYYLAYSIDADSQLVRTIYVNSDGTNIYGTPKIMARNISSLTFSRTSAASEVIDIEISAQVDASQGTVKRTLRSSVKLRN